MTAQYTEICSTHSNITDFRGKLLALFPIVGAGGLLIVIGKTYSDSPDTNQMPETLTPVAVFALFITVGLFLYELRQIKECLTLRQQAAAIEDWLRVPPGVAQFRDNPRLTGGAIGAELGSWVVYVTLIATWTYIAFTPWLPRPAFIIILGFLTIVVILLQAIQIKKRDSRRCSKVKEVLTNAKTSPEGIASELHMDMSDVVTTLARLAKAGKVELQPGTNEWQLTEKGPSTSSSSATDEGPEIDSATRTNPNQSHSMS